MRRRLTPAERNEIGACIREGIPRREIAARFGVSVNHVYKMSRTAHGNSETRVDSALPVGVRIDYKAAGQLLVHTASKSATRALFTVGHDVFDEVVRLMRRTDNVSRAMFNERALQETTERCVRLVRRWQGAEQIELEVIVVTAPPTPEQTISPSWVLYLLLRDAFSGSRVRVTRQPTHVEEDTTARAMRYREMLAELDQVTHLEDG